MVGVAGDAVEQRGANRPSRGGRYRDPRRERSGRKDRGAVPATLREVGADAVRAADEKAGGIERVEFGIKVVEADADRSEEHTSELQSLMRISYAVFCLKKKKKNQQ